MRCAYRDYASGYFEIDVPVDAIEHVLAGNPLDDALLRRISPTRLFDEVADELRAVGYVIR